MKISEMITDKYKLRIPLTVYYDLLSDVVEIEEQEPTTKNDLAVEKTDMIDKSNFSQEQYKTDLQSAYDCGYEQAKNDLGVDFDCISRFSAEQVVRYHYCDIPLKVYNKLMGELDSLPSVTPQEPKRGHWILADVQNKEDVENDNYRFICSECQCSDIHAKGTVVPYCWKCGAKMVEPQESEDT